MAVCVEYYTHCLRAFPKITHILRSIDRKKFDLWMKERFSKQLKLSTLNKWELDQ